MAHGGKFDFTPVPFVEFKKRKLEKMCKCDPNIRTPYCGRGDCVPPKQKDKKERRKAWSDFKDHVVICAGGTEIGMDTGTALHLYKQLEQAIKDSI